ncbi:hypothetical protein F5146DRAFT_997271 [Armillaria mellea]|nr:hypothetical protein F5146DRAFT_997271 [Armillaria mellea]
MTSMVEYDTVFEYLCFPDEEPYDIPSIRCSGCLMIAFRGQDDTSPLLLFSGEIDGPIPIGDACLTPPSLFQDSEPYVHNDWSPAGSLLLHPFYVEDESPETVNPAVLTGPTPPSSLPSPSSSSLCTTQDPSLTSPSNARSGPAPTLRHVRSRYSRQAKAKSYRGVDESKEDEYERKCETESPKRSRRYLVTPELVPDTSSSASTPFTLSTPISGTRSPRPTRILPHRIVKKHAPAVDDQDLDSDADDGKKTHKARGSGKFECDFPNCTVRFQRDIERRRHRRNQHSQDPPAGRSCEHCSKPLSRRDAVLRHYLTCEVLHPNRPMGKRKGGVAGKSVVSILLS